MCLAQCDNLNFERQPVGVRQLILSLSLSSIHSCNAVVYNPVIVTDGQGFKGAECPEVSENLEVNLRTVVIAILSKIKRLK